MSASSQLPASAAFPGLRRDTPYFDARRDDLPSSLGSPEHVSLAHPQHPVTILLLFTGYSNHPVWHQLVLDAAYVLSGNRRGFLSRSHNDVSLRISESQDSLPTGHYHYILERHQEAESPSNWQVVPMFEKWTFPHEEFSARFPQSTASGTSLSHWRIPKSEEPEPDNSNFSEMSTSVRLRHGGRCVLSGYQCDSTASQNSHLVPQAQSTSKWFEDCEMDVYKINPNLTGQDAINDVGNGILLRSDLHGQLDGGKQGQPAWLPYPAPVVKLYIASYCLNSTNPDHANEFHNVPLNLGSSISEAYLFARFAWCIFRRAARATQRSQPAAATDPQAGQQLGKHDRDSGWGSTRLDDVLDSPGQHDPDTGSKMVGKSSENQGKRSSRTTAVFSDDPRLDEIAKDFVATHPAIRAIGEPERISPGVVAWLQPLDADERRQYET